MGREGSWGCQECVRAVADKSGAGQLGGDLFHFLLMLIGLTWHKRVGLCDCPLPWWLHPREGDILPMAIGEREGMGVTGQLWRPHSSGCNVVPAAMNQA